jgi:hypothetical protein
MKTYVLITALVFFAFLCIGGNTWAIDNPNVARDKVESGEDHPWGGENDVTPGGGTEGGGDLSGKLDSSPAPAFAIDIYFAKLLTKLYLDFIDFQKDTTPIAPIVDDDPDQTVDTHTTPSSGGGSRM